MTIGQKNTETRSIDFVSKIKPLGGLSLVLFLLSLIFLLVKGLPYGIDFSGGTEIQIHFQEKASVGEVRQVVEGLKVSHLSVQEFGGPQDYLIRFQLPQASSAKESNEIQNQAVASVKNSFVQGSLQSLKPEIVRVDSVGPQVGADLKKSGFLSVFYSLLLILIYIAMRFDYKFSPGAVLCLVHDVVITLALFSLLGKELNVPIVAAVLTLIGFSLNDTIVVFDRIRETSLLHTKLSFAEVINKAINDVWKRTIVTSGTTLSVSLALLFLTTGTISDIALVMSIGIIVGTYSSIYVASPLTLWVDTLLGDKPLNIIPKPRFSDK
jgi:preprotein translocase subunit SecF